MRMESNLQQPAECWTLVVDRGEKIFRKQRRNRESL